MTLEETREPFLDPVIEAYKRFVDESLLLENLKRTPTERLLAMPAMLALVEEAHRAGTKAGLRR